ncbi:MAG: response regulator, partial [Calditrichaeota bacterium]
EEEETFPAVEESSEEDELDELIGDLLDETETEEETTESPMEDLSTPEEEAGLGEDLDLDDLFEETPELESEESVEELGSTSEDFETPPAEAEAAFPEETTTIEDMQVSIDETELFEPQTEEETEAPEAPLEVETPPETGERPTVLVVDDSVVIRKMVEIALENENLNIVSVATGKEALNYLDENTPNVIILDIMLSDMNGLDVLKAIKASKDIPVVMLSAKDTPRETTKAKQLGADDFIPKPFKDEELVAKIKELVQKSA